ncbi:MAG: DUF1289 domain-containing protein [Alphaproteobacteria bacterium]|nr:DUF1289 domain-containing protein [Alphaproteobacteria bacterium]
MPAPTSHSLGISTVMVPSPCISVCDIHQENGYCRGCYRTTGEITDWLTMDDTRKKEVLDMLEKRKHLCAGLSVFEAAVALMMIGLIVAVITVGKEIVQHAAVRKQMVQLDGIEAGIQNFRLKYGCMPGDCLDPTVISGYTYSGNGNGFLEGTWNDDEHKGFWLHLSLSKMIDDPLVDHSQLSGMKTVAVEIHPLGVINPFGSMTYAQNVLELATTAVEGAFQVRQIASIDEKIDDGLAASGNIRSSGYGSGATTIYSGNPTFPLSTGNNSGSDKCIASGLYDGNTTPYCNMIYILERQ